MGSCCNHEVTKGDGKVFLVDSFEQKNSTVQMSPENANPKFSTLHSSIIEQTPQKKSKLKILTHLQNKRQMDKRSLSNTFY